MKDSRLSHCLESGKVNDGIDGVLCEEIAYGLLIAEIHPHKGKFLPQNRADTSVVGLVTIGHIIRYHNVIACLDKFDRNVTSDESGASGNEYCCFHNILFIL